MERNAPAARQNELVVQELNDELLIYDLLANKCFCLNRTATAVWYLCDGKNSVSDISAKLSEKLKQSVPEDLIWISLDQLKHENLLSEAAGLAQVLYAGGWEMDRARSISIGRWSSIGARRRLRQR